MQLDRNGVELYNFIYKCDRKEGELCEEKVYCMVVSSGYDMLVSSVPVTTLAAEESGSSEAELFNEGTDSGEEVSLSSEAEDFSDEEIIGEPEGNLDAAQKDDAAEMPESPEISETEDPVNQEPADGDMVRMFRMWKMVLQMM